RDGPPEKILEADAVTVVARQHPVGPTFELRLLEPFLRAPDLRGCRRNGRALRLRLSRELSRHADRTRRQASLDLCRQLDRLDWVLRRQVLKCVEAGRLRTA